jgi:hypothetical protein
VAAAYGGRCCRCCGGVLAGYLLADGVAGVVTAVIGVFGARALVDRGVEVKAALPDQVLGGGLRRVHEVDDRSCWVCILRRGTLLGRCLRTWAVVSI